MSARVLPFHYVEEQLRRMHFGILGTVTPDGRSHSTAIVYGVSAPGARLALYVLTERSYKKTRNIRANPNVSFVVPFPHHLLRSVPSSCVQFQGRAEVLSCDDPEGRASFQRNSVLRMTLEQGATEPERAVFLKITPDEKVFGYGLGMSLLALSRNIEAGPFETTVPRERLPEGP
jgi:general stress protein 26